MKKIVLFLLLSGYLLADESSLKVVYDLTTGNVKEFKQKILQGIVFNKAHYEREFKELDVSVVIHGGAYKFFFKTLKNTPYEKDKQLLKEFESLKKRIASLSEIYDVEFNICEVGLKNRKIQKKSLASFVKIIPNAAITLIDKQNNGFAYLRVGD